MDSARLLLVQAAWSCAPAVSPTDAAHHCRYLLQFGGSVLGGCLATGARDALVASLVLMQEHGVSEVVVEAVQPGAHHFTCSVLATDQVRATPGWARHKAQAFSHPWLPVMFQRASQLGCRPALAHHHHQWQVLCLCVAQGAVALPPTELSYWDVEDDIAECELRMERWLAAREVGPRRDASRPPLGMWRGEAGAAGSRCRHGAEAASELCPLLEACMLGAVCGGTRVPRCRLCAGPGP